MIKNRGIISAVLLGVVAIILATGTLFTPKTISDESITLGGGTGTISQLDQWTATTSPSVAITQKVFGKPIKITGLSTGDCLTLNASSILATTTCGAGGGTWGSITGTLSDQTDLQSALDSKLSTTTAATTYVPYTGATGDINLGLNGLTANDLNISGQTASRIAIFDASKNVISADTATYPSLTELSYVKGVTSAIQTQLNTKVSGSGTSGQISYWDGSSSQTGSAGLLFDTAGTLDLKGNTTGHLRIWSANSAGGYPYISGLASRGTYASPTTLTTNGDYLLTINAQGYNGTNYVGGASIVMRARGGTPSATSMPGQFLFYTTPTGSTSQVLRGTIDSQGRWGIGNISDPATNTQLQITQAQTYGLIINNGSTEYRVRSLASGIIEFDSTGGASVGFQFLDKVQVDNSVASDIALRVKAASSQSASMQEWQNSAGTRQMWIGSDGYSTNIGANAGYDTFSSLHLTASPSAANTGRFAIYGWDASAGSFPSFRAITSRGTVGSRSAVQSGDGLGGLQFWGTTGASGYSLSSSISGYAAENFSGSAYGGKLVFSTVTAGTTTDVERLAISSAGVIFNETGADVDLRIEGDTDTNLFFADASTDRIGIGTNTPGSKLDVAGSLQADSITNDTGLAHGTYTPTLTSVANVTSSTARQATYMRVGNTVTVAGQIDVTPTVNNTQTTIRISLPISSNFSTAYQAAGAGHTANNTVAGHGASIVADATNDEVVLDYYETNGVADTISYTFTYQVI